MNRMKRLCGLVATISMLGTSSAMAVIAFDANVTNNAIFGSGNGNGFWTTDTANNVELGLRAKVRWAGIYNSNIDGTYNHDTGISSGSAAKWNYEFSINVNQNGSSGLTLSDYHIALSIDIDPSEGVSWITFDPTTAWADNSYGDNSTAQSSGIEPGAFTNTELLNTWSLVQNSQNLGWAPIAFDPNLDATYDFKLSAIQVTGAPGAETSMRVIVGKGGRPVPDSAATASLLGLALASLLVYRRRFGK